MISDVISLAGLNTEIDQGVDNSNPRNNALDPEDEVEYAYEDDSDLEDDSNTDAIKLLTRAEDVPLDDWCKQEMRVPYRLRISQPDESDPDSLSS